METFFGLSDEAIVITGASGGVGKASALLLSAVAGAKLALVSRRGAEDVVAEISAAGGLARSYQADVSSRIELAHAFKKIAADFGSVRSLLNIAGTCDFYPVEAGPAEKSIIDDVRWERIVGVNGKGAALAIEFAVPLMKPGSSIVNVGSTAGSYGAEMAVVDYTFSKAGLVGLTMAYAKILGPLGIRVNGVAPGPIEGTEMLAAANEDSLNKIRGTTKLGRLCRPEDVAKIVLFLASQMSAVMTGATVDANCGQYISA